MLAVGYLLLTNGLVVLQSSGTSGLTAGIYQELYVLFSGELFKDVELVVEVIVYNDDMVVLFQLCKESLFGVKALAGGGGQLELWIVPAEPR